MMTSMLLMSLPVYANEPTLANDYVGGCVPVESVETGEDVSIQVNENVTITMDSGFVTSDMVITIVDNENDAVTRAFPFYIKVVTITQASTYFDETIYYREYATDLNGWYSGTLTLLGTNRLSDGRYEGVYSGPLFPED